MKLILTEKPSVATEFAKALNCTKSDGYFSNSEYLITYGFGHLYTIDDSEYKNEKWSIEPLPIFPESFKLCVVDEAYTKKQAAIIKTLVAKASKVIIATDAGREGELIGRNILSKSGWKKWATDTYRFWVSGPLTHNAIMEGLSKVKPSSEYNSLYFSAMARQQSDWISGINLTRYITCKVNSGSVWSAGRVQSPTLNLIVKREHEITNYKPVEYYPVKLELNKEINFMAYYVPLEKDALISKELSDKILNECSLIKAAKVVSYDTKENKQNPPVLFSLTELSKEASRIYNFKLDETLEIAQTLYEKYKVLSYPRSDSTHLADDSQELVISILKKIAPQLIDKVEAVGKRVFDSSKLTDHHALIPFGLLPESASDNERKIFQLVVNRFLAAFNDPYVFSSTVAIFDLSNFQFKSTGKTDISLGWKSVYQTESEEKNEGKLPRLNVSEQIPVVRLFSEKASTKPPLRYTDGTLVDLMKKHNLGTVATRAEIVKRLLTTKYLVMEKKCFVPTQKGIELIRLFSESEFIDVDFVGGLELKLDNIYTQKMSYEVSLGFLNEMKDFVKKEIEKLKEKQVTQGVNFRSATSRQIELAKSIAERNKDKSFDKKNKDYDYVSKYIDDNLPKREDNEIEKKPKEIIRELPCSCKKKGTIKEYNKYYRCSCNKMVFKEVAGVMLSIEQVFQLYKGEEIIVIGCKGSKGNFDPPIKIGKSGKVEFNFKKSKK